MLGPKKGQKFWSKKILGPKKLLVRKTFSSKKLLVRSKKKFESKENFGPQKNYVSKKGVQLKTILVKKALGQLKFQVQKGK